MSSQCHISVSGIKMFSKRQFLIDRDELRLDACGDEFFVDAGR